jgi:biotin synthase-related radical SAM superfamily protein
MNIGKENVSMDAEQSFKEMVTQGESPEFVQTSLAGAMCMGLAPGKFHRNAQCGCLNLLLTYHNGCRASCSYCGLARNRNTDSSNTFIRVKWPTYLMSDIISRVQTRTHPFKRACVSMVTHGRALDDACTIINNLRDNTDLPVSGLLSPTVMKKGDLERIRDAGADRVGIAIDTVTPELFDKHRAGGVGGPHRWDVYMQSLEDAVDVFGSYKVGVHVIVGLGETEQQMVAFIDRTNKMKVATHLFSFFPESGSVLEFHPQPPLDQYRRIQLARYLINEKIVSLDSMHFSPSGEVVDFGIEIDPYIVMGLPFMTSGCPGNDGLLACNRPFGNERASEPMRNYPFLPEQGDIGIIRNQLR